MATSDIWKVLTPASLIRTFAQITVTEGVERNIRGNYLVYLGVNASTWVNEARAQSTCVRAALRILFLQLCRLLMLPVLPIFVFNASTSAQTNLESREFVKHFRVFIEAFGFCSYAAPGEAEAEIAYLNKHHFVDGIISDDPSALVFGARTLLRMFKYKHSSEQTQIYISRLIFSHPVVNLSQAGLFLLAILLGRDNFAGLPGCSVAVAHELATTYLAKTLFDATIQLSRSDLASFLVEWRENLKIELATDPNDMGMSSITISANFPSIELLYCYVSPVTTWSNGTGPDRSHWGSREPNLLQIGALCERFFLWGSKYTIISELERTLWVGVVIRHLLNLPSIDVQLDAHFSGRAIGGSFTTASILRIVHGCVGPSSRRTGANTFGYLVEISTYTLARDAISLLGMTVKSRLSRQLPDRAIIWISASILNLTLSKLVEIAHSNGIPQPSFVLYYDSIFSPDNPLSTIKSLYQRRTF